MTTRRLFISALGGVAALALSLAPGASASNVSIGSTMLSYYAAPGEVNRVTIAYTNGAFVVTDQFATLEARSGCTRIDIHRARCPGQPTARSEEHTSELQ